MKTACEKTKADEIILGSRSPRDLRLVFSILSRDLLKGQQALLLFFFCVREILTYVAKVSDFACIANQVCFQLLCQEAKHAYTKY